MLERSRTIHATPTSASSTAVPCRDRERAARARVVLDPFVTTDSVVVQPPAGRARPDAARNRRLLAGRLLRSPNEFCAALALDSSVTDARRQLLEIETATGSWVRVSTDVWDDDQPLRYAAFNAEGGWFINPLTPLGVRARSSVYDVRRHIRSDRWRRSELHQLFPEYASAISSREPAWWTGRSANHSTGRRGRVRRPAAPDGHPRGEVRPHAIHEHGP